MKRSIGSLLIALMIFFTMSFSCFAAPAANYAGRITDTSLPIGFTDGYLYANHDTYNSPASQNGLEGTYIWFEGTFNSFEKIQMAEGNVFTTVVTDLDGKQWLVIMEMEQYCTEEALTQLFNVPLAITARYSGLSNTYNMPAVFMTKLCNISTGKISTSALAYLSYDNIPLSTEITKSQKQKTIGRYYYTPDNKNYDTKTYIQINDVRNTSIEYTIVINGVTCSTDRATREPGLGDGSGINYYKSKADECFISIGGPVIVMAGIDNVSNRKTFIKID